MTRSVLLVEDNRNDVVLMREALTDIDTALMVHVVGDLASAWTWLVDVSRDHIPSLLVTDHHLPDGFGQDLISRLHTSPIHKSVPLVMVSSDMQQPVGLCGVMWFGKPDTWAGWRQLARELVRMVRN